MAYVKKDLHKSHRMHHSMSREAETLEMLSCKSTAYTKATLLKFNHIVNRSASSSNNIDERLKSKEDPWEVLASLEESANVKKSVGRREELEMADKFKQRVIHGFEREGRAFMKQWILKLSKKNQIQGNYVIDYMTTMKTLDGAFNNMKASDCEMRMQEIVKGVETSYSENNRCLARLSEVEGNIIEIKGKYDRAKERLITDLEKISSLNSKKQMDEETKVIIQNMMNKDIVRYTLTDEAKTRK